MSIDTNNVLSIKKNLLVDCIEYYTYRYDLKLNNIDIRISTIQLEEQIKELILNNIESLVFYAKNEENEYCYVEEVLIIDDLNKK